MKLSNSQYWRPKCNTYIRLKKKKQNRIILITILISKNYMHFFYVIIVKKYIFLDQMNVEMKRQKEIQILKIEDVKNVIFQMNG